MTKFEKAEIIAYVLGLILCGYIKVHYAKKVWTLAESVLQEMAAKQIARYRQ